MSLASFLLDPVVDIAKETGNVVADTRQYGKGAVNTMSKGFGDSIRGIGGAGKQLLRSTGDTLDVSGKQLSRGTSETLSTATKSFRGAYGVLWRDNY